MSRLNIGLDVPLVGQQTASDGTPLMLQAGRQGLQPHGQQACWYAAACMVYDGCLLVKRPNHYRGSTNHDQICGSSSSVRDTFVASTSSSIPAEASRYTTVFNSGPTTRWPPTEKIV